MMNRISIYIHIPFCVRKCQYCDFLSFPDDEDSRSAYVNALVKEIRSYKEFAKNKDGYTLYFGGGTPSVLSIDEMTKIMQAIYSTFSMNHVEEITIEMNPGTVTNKKLKRYLELGINRLSMGLQSTHNKELRMLGRIHTYEEFIAQYDAAREMGFKNISVDVMSGLPNQKLSQYEESLFRICELKPEHISSYSLIVEEGTPLSKNTKLLDGLPGEELDRIMYQRTNDILDQNGYHRYEISNYAKEEKESKHNSVYWEGGQYLGIGLGASSYIREKGQWLRFRNEANPKKYIQNQENGINPREELELLSMEDQMEEYMFLGLRLCKGISYERFANRFGHRMNDIYGDIIAKNMEAGLLIKNDDILRLSNRGIDVSNYVFSQFILS